jgi:hypothetical protein
MRTTPRVAVESLLAHVGNTLAVAMRGIYTYNHIERDEQIRGYNEKD